ncbi:MAG TPA: TonB-dependent receptor, partial [Gemmatimonadales bacterium]
MPTSVHILVVLAGIHGTVRSAGHGGPLAGVRIEIDGGTSLSSDTAGRYAATGLEPGPHEIRFLAAGYRIERATVLLSDSSDLALDIELTPQPLLLSPIEVVADSARRSPAGSAGLASVVDEAGHYRFTSGWQANQPASATDIQQLIATIPGVTTRNDNTTALSIRGGRGSENLTLLDGIPIIGAVHFTGASSAINPDAIATVDVHTGVSSARYDDALSGVVELATADAAPQHAQVTSALTISDVRSVFQAPLEPGGSVLLGARSSFRNLLTDGAGFGAVNGYQDFIGAGHLRLGAGTVGMVAFASDDHLNWQPVADATRSIPADDGSGSANASTENDAAWRSDAAGITWTLPGGIGAEWRAAGWWTGSSASISLQSRGQSQHLTNTFGELGLSIERRQRYAASSLVLGGELKQPRTSYDVATWYGTQRQDSGFAIATAPLLASLYGEWDWQASGRLDLRVGTRVSNGAAGVMNIDPRLALNVQLEPGTRFEAAAGRTHQTTQSLLNEENLTSTIVGPPLMMLSAAGVPIATADQWQLGIDRQAGNGLAIALDAYLRSWYDVVVPATTGALLAAAMPGIGAGRSRGLLASVSIL